MRAAVSALALLAACASRPTLVQKSEQALAFAHAATQEARTAFEEWTLKHRDAEWVRSLPADRRETIVAEYEKREDAVLAAFTAAYTSQVALATILPLMSNGKLALGELLMALERMHAAAESVRAAVEAIREAGP